MQQSDTSNVNPPRRKRPSWLLAFGSVLVMVVCSAAIAGCGQSSGGKSVPVRASKVDVNKEFVHIAADVDKAVRRGDTLEISYTVLYCDELSGVDVTSVRSGSVQVIHVDGLAEMNGKDDCKDAPSPYHEKTEVSVLDDVSSFEFVKSDRGSAPPSGAEAGFAEGEGPSPGDASITATTATEIFNRSDIAKGQHSCQKTAAMPDVSGIAAEFDFICTKSVLAGTPTGKPEGYAVNFVNDEVSALADLSEVPS